MQPADNEDTQQGSRSDEHLHGPYEAPYAVDLGDVREGAFEASLEHTHRAAMINVKSMLDSLLWFSDAERAEVYTGLERRLRRLRYTTSGIVFGGTTGLTFLVAFLAIPGLLQWITPTNHNFAISIVFYICSLVIGLILTILIVFLAAFILDHDPESRILWAWDEAREHRPRPRPRGNSYRRVLVGLVTLFYLSVGIALLAYLRLGDPAAILELLTTICLIPLLTIIAALGSFAIDRIARPSVHVQRRGLMQLDRTSTNFLNLAYYIHVNIAGWDSPTVRQRLLREFTRAAQEAEGELPGIDAVSIRKDPRARRWAEQESMRLAQGIRNLRARVLTAFASAELALVRDSLCAGLYAITKGDWAELRATEAAPATRIWVLRFGRLILPSAILVAAAFVLPELPSIATQESVKGGLQLSLFAAAALSLLQVIGGPETNRVSDLIQKATDRLSGRSPNE